MSHFFHQSIAAWDTDDFAKTLYQELSASGLISLIDLMQQGSAPLFDSVRFSLLKAECAENKINVKLSVFFHSVIAGCQCADDPNPVDPIPEYAEVALTIDVLSGHGDVKAI